jgi:hypothetical protein
VQGVSVLRSADPLASAGASNHPPQPGRSRSGVSIWLGLSRRPLVVSLTCSSQWTSSPSGLRRNPLSKPTLKRPSSSSGHHLPIWCTKHHHHKQRDQLHKQEVLGVHRRIRDLDRLGVGRTPSHQWASGERE